MELDEFKRVLDRQEKAELDMSSAVIAQLNRYHDDIKKLASYCSDLVDSQGNKIAIDTYKIGLFRTHAFDWKGETDGVVYLDMLEPQIAIDIRDTSHDEEDIELGIPKGPAMPMKLTANNLAYCIADNNNFEMAMLATNPNMLIKYAVEDASKRVKDINNRIEEFNGGNN